MIKNARKSFFIVEKIKKYRKCPPLPSGHSAIKGRVEEEEEGEEEEEEEEEEKKEEEKE